MEEFNVLKDILEAGGLLAAVLLFAVLLYRGNIVTKTTVDKIVAVYDKRIKEQAELYEKQIEGLVEFYEKQYGALLDQNKKLFEHIEKYLDK